MADWEPYSAELPYVLWAQQKQGYRVRDTRDGKTYIAESWREVQELATDLAELSQHQGAGDLVHALTKKLGVPHCADCARRKGKLNSWFPKLWRRRS